MFEVLSVIGAFTGLLAIGMQIFVINDRIFRLEVISKTPFYVLCDDVLEDFKGEGSQVYKWMRFINKSGVPVTIISMQIASLVSDSVVSNSVCSEKFLNYSRNTNPVKLPLVIEPYGVVDGYFKFSMYGPESTPKEGDNIMIVVTSRKTIQVPITIDYTERGL